MRIENCYKLILYPMNIKRFGIVEYNFIFLLSNFSSVYHVNAINIDEVF